MKLRIPSSESKKFTKENKSEWIFSELQRRIPCMTKKHSIIIYRKFDLQMLLLNRALFCDRRKGGIKIWKKKNWRWKSKKHADEPCTTL